MSDRAPTSPPDAVVVQKTYDLVLWLLPKVEKFPRSYRFTVGERLTQAALDLLLKLVDAAYARNKQPPLAAASAEVNAIRYLLRLAHDLKLLPHAGHLHAAERLDEIGRMVGGWRRAVDGPP